MSFFCCNLCCSAFSTSSFIELCFGSIRSWTNSNVDTINGRLYEVSDVDIENSKIILETTGGIILENDDDGYLRNEDIANFTLSNPRTAEAYDDIDLSNGVLCVFAGKGAAKLLGVKV